MATTTNLQLRALKMSVLISICSGFSPSMAQESVVGTWHSQAMSTGFGASITLSLRPDGTYERLGAAVLASGECSKFATLIKGRYEISDGKILFYPASNLKTCSDGSKIDLGIAPPQYTFGIDPVALYFRDAQLCFDNGEHESCMSRQP